MNITTKKILKNKNGSTFIIVISVLSILALIAVTLSYTSRMEVISAANYANNIQARIAAVSGLPIAKELFSQNTLTTSYSQKWANAEIPDLKESNKEKDSIVKSEISTPQTPASSISNVLIIDESSKVNINSAGNLQNMGFSVFEVDLEKVISEALKINSLDPSTASSITQAIISYRNGPDGKPGIAGIDDDGDSSGSVMPFGVEFDNIDNNQDSFTDDGNDGIDKDGLDNDADGVIDEPAEGIDEPDEFISDIRVKPNGDDTPFYSLEQLKDIELITPEIYDAISPYLTIFSATSEIIPLKTYEETNFKNKNNDIQLVKDDNTSQSYVKPIDINTAPIEDIITFIGEYFPEKNQYLIKQYAANIIDARDTDDVPTIYYDSDVVDAQPIIGVEMTPYINEVWPDSKTDSENGDDGQYIEIFNPYSTEIDMRDWRLNVAGSDIKLNIIIPPSGYLIITDDYDDSNDPTPEDDLDGVGSLFKIFDIVPAGNTQQVIEEQALEIPDDSGTIELHDPVGNLIDSFTYMNGIYNYENNSFQRTDPRLKFTQMVVCTPFEANIGFEPPDKTESFPIPQNTIFASPIEIMNVYSGFYDEDLDELYAWAFPSISSEDAQYIDSSLIDLFIVPNYNISVLNNADNDETTNTLSISGKININTAPYEVLLSLPGITNDIAKAIVNYRIEVQSKETTTDSVPFSTLSDLFQNDQIWKDYSTQERITAFSAIENLITVRSRSFMVIFNNNTGEETKISKSEDIMSLVATDKNSEYNILQWRYLK